MKSWASAVLISLLTVAVPQSEGHATNAAASARAASAPRLSGVDTPGGTLVPVQHAPYDPSQSLPSNIKRMCVTNCDRSFDQMMGFCRMLTDVKGKGAAAGDAECKDRATVQRNTCRSKC